MEQDNVIALAEDILTRRYGGTQRLTDATRLPGSGFSGVYRARVAANPFLQHRSVVVKQSPETGDVLEDAAFLREVVAYQFTTSLSEDVRPGPVLLGYDTAQRIIIISDSGDGDTLETLLTPRTTANGCRYCATWAPPSAGCTRARRARRTTTTSSSPA